MTRKLKLSSLLRSLLAASLLHCCHSFITLAHSPQPLDHNHIAAVIVLSATYWPPPPPLLCDLFVRVIVRRARIGQRQFYRLILPLSVPVST